MPLTRLRLRGHLQARPRRAATQCRSYASETAVPRSPAPSHPQSPRVDAVVLAAGRSSRMGRPKPLLRIDGETFVERVVRILRAGGCERVVVVTRPDARRVAEVAAAAGAVHAVNPDGDAEQVASLRIGLAALDDHAAAAVLLPVDHPLVRPRTVAAVIDAYRARRAPVVRAVHDGRPGHPTLIDRSLFAELEDDPLPRGAETVVERYLDRIEDVAVDDPGVVADIDTPGEYRREVEAAGRG